MGRRGPPAGGRLFVSLSHTINLEDQRVLADGFPVQDFLNGAASGLGGQPEHEVRLTSGVFYKGYGARLSANWQSATEVDTSSSVLKFSDQTSVNLRFFHSVTNQTFIGRNVEWLRGTRFSLEIDNLLDEDFIRYMPYTSRGSQAYSNEYAINQEPRRLWLSVNVSS